MHRRKIPKILESHAGLSPRQARGVAAELEGVGQAVIRAQEPHFQALNKDSNELKKDVGELKTSVGKLEEGQTATNRRLEKLEEGQTRLEEGQSKSTRNIIIAIGIAALFAYLFPPGGGGTREPERAPPFYVPYPPHHGMPGGWPATAPAESGAPAAPGGPAAAPAQDPQSRGEGVGGKAAPAAAPGSGGQRDGADITPAGSSEEDGQPGRAGARPVAGASETSGASSRGCGGPAAGESSDAEISPAQTAATRKCAEETGL